MGTSFLVDGPEVARRTLVLAHGAGAPMDSPFMGRVAKSVAEQGIRVARFEFPYMAERRATGKRRGPNPSRVLEQTWCEVIEELGPAEHLVIGGKSMGGRIASMVADRTNVAGVVCLGYPFHPPGRPEKLRVAHLKTLSTPGLIIHGTRDPFGSPDEIASYDLPETIRVAFLEDGDHSFKPRVKSGHTLSQHLDQTVAWIVEFVNER